MNNTFILKLYPKGTLEFDGQTLTSTAMFNKMTIDISDVYDVELVRPTLFKNGFFYVYSDKTYTLNFLKSHLDDALVLFNVLKSILINNNTSNQSIQKQQLNDQITRDPRIKEFECTIKEEKTGFGVGSRKTDILHAIVTLHNDYILIEKNSFWRGKDRGSKKILYQDISSVDFDRPSTLNFAYNIEITVSGSNIIILESPQQEQAEDFYNRLSHTVEDYKLFLHKQNNTPTQPTSNPDELKKWYQLMKEGIISSDEFEAKKKELLGL